MTEREAISRLTEYQLHLTPEGRLAITALEKQTPRKPTRNRIDYPYRPPVEVAQCGRCKRRLRTKLTTANGDKFCPNCGQRIDWREVDE